MKNLLPILLFSFLALIFSAHKGYNEQEQQTAKNSPDKSTASFIENKGQWHENILFRTNLPGTFNSLFLEENRLTYQVYNQDDIGDLHDRKDADEAFLVSGHSYHVYFKNAQIPTAKSVGIRAGKNNYFIGNQAEKWAKDVNVSEEIIYDDIYQDIDLRFYKIYDDFKYEFIVAPGANPQEIIQEYVGAENINIEKNQLKITTSVATMTELAPYTYQIENGIKKQIPCFYQLENNEVRFSFPEGYDTEKELIIDPTVVAATLTGHNIVGSVGAFGYAATYDAVGNNYIGSMAFGSGYIVTTGAFDEEFNGEQDIIITKFNPTGTELLYATYVGGSEDENPISMITDANENTYVYGNTSSQDFPVTADAFQNSINGEKDIIIYALNAEGNSLLSSTFIGGTNDDGASKSSFFNCFADEDKGEIVLDEQNNIYLSSMTCSADFPIVDGFDNTFADNPTGFSQDAVVLKMNSNLSEIIWSSFLGSSDVDLAMSLRVLENEEVYVTGFTQGEDFPTTPESFMPNHPGGNVNGFITKISADGTEILKSTFVGTTGSDRSYYIDIDAEGIVHITGITSGEMAISDDVYSGVAGSPQFIMGLSADLDTAIYSTVIGLGPGGEGYEFLNSNIDFVPNAFTVDDCGYIYLSALGAAENLPLTDGNFWTEGNSFYMIKLSPLAKELEFASYYGRANHVDGGMSRIDKKGTIYQAVCSCDNGGDFVLNITPDAFSGQSDISFCDVGIFKIEHEQTADPNAVWSLGNSFFISTDSVVNTGVFPLSLDFVFTGQNAENVIWNFGDGNTSTELNPSHIFTNIGTYTVTVTASNPNTCNEEDTYNLTIEVTGDLNNIEEENTIDLLVSPNPNQGSFSVITTGQIGEITFSIFDIRGKLLLKKMAISDKTDFDLNVPAGVYFLQAEMENGVLSTEKLVVTR